MAFRRADAGKRTVVQGITGFRGIRSKRSRRGFMRETEFTVLRGNCGGPTVGAVRDSRLAIGRGMAQRIVGG
jgi:Fe2+ transport system protein FeoA